MTTADRSPILHKITLDPWASPDGIPRVTMREAGALVCVFEAEREIASLVAEELSRWLESEVPFVETYLDRIERRAQEREHRRMVDKVLSELGRNMHKRS